MGKKFKNKDLAARLGVSGTLVSLVLNNKADQHGIRKDTQEKVFALARQMGYFNALAEKKIVAPTEMTPGLVGMIVPPDTDTFVSGIAPCLQKAFAGIGLGFSIITRDPDDQRFDRMIGAFRKFFSGLILYGDAADDSTLRTLRSADYPFVTLEKSNRSGRFNCLCTDTRAGAQLVANHIKKLGYKNIIILTERKSFNSDLQVISDIENSISLAESVNKPVTIETDRSPSDNEIDFGQLEDFFRPPFRGDILITLHANMVYPLIDFLKKKKLRVPQDIAIMSMEEGAGFDFITPAITCLRKPLPGMAFKLANMLWSEIKNSGKIKFKRQVNVTPDLIIRNSCGSM